LRIARATSGKDEESFFVFYLSISLYNLLTLDSRSSPSHNYCIWPPAGQGFRQKAGQAQARALLGTQWLGLVRHGQLTTLYCAFVGQIPFGRAPVHPFPSVPLSLCPFSFAPPFRSPTLFFPLMAPVRTDGVQVPFEPVSLDKPFC
jgi:hypothetical protein